MRVLLFLILIFGVNIFVNAQTAILSGKIYDANGALVVKAKVTAINEKLEKYEALTNSEGVYKLELPFKKYDSRISFRITKYVLTVEAAGFEKFVLKGFNLVPSTYGKMLMDVALDIDNSNCGAGGCIPENSLLPPQESKLSDKIIEKPLETLPKAQNKTKRKINKHK